MTAVVPKSGPRTLRAPRGTKLSTKGWQQEAALRMLMNNLDPEVAEDPDNLVVYGGTGRAARSWEAFDAIVAELQRLEHDETLLVQSGKPVGVFRTTVDAPRVLIANANLVPHWATWEQFRELEGAGLTMYGQMTAGSWIYIATQGIIQGTYETIAHDALGGYVPGGIGLEEALMLRADDPAAYVRRSMQSMAAHVRAMLAFQQRGAVVFDYGNNIRAQAHRAGVANAFDFPGFVPAFIRPLFCEGKGPFRWAALSGEPEDILRTDRAVLEL